ncbi:hypothetical protein [Cryptosporangium sp. NPDC051539]
MSGSYHKEYHRCDEWDYNDCYRPRRRRFGKKRHDSWGEFSSLGD